MGIILQSLGLQTLADQPSGAVYSDVTPPSRSDVTSVTTRTALSLPSVYRSVQISAGMASQLSIGAYRNGQRIDTPAIMLKPDPWRPLQSWIERVVIDLMCDGNAFLRKVKDDSGKVVALLVLNPFAVAVRRNPKTGLKSFVYASDGNTQTFSADEIVHLWGMEVPGQERGLSPIAYCRLSISGAIDVRDFASGWFKSGDVPSGTLTTDQPLDSAALREYKRVWHEGEAHDIRVLGRGLKYTPIMIKPEDAQWIEAQKFTILDIARLFGVPAAYLYAGVDGSALTYQNLEQVDAQFLRTTLFPVYLSKIEAALSDVLPLGQTAKFDTAELLRPDSKTRAEIHQIMIAAGVYDGDHARTVEGIPGPAPAPRKEVAA